ncbi:MAG TPA: efflux RND transporter permease subunit [Gammaproteobacteria bacterium]|nr:efflux RND transporter permease subunit [Xanthomonadales bacterium]MCB1593924.1 efflux RND transporter permease subunit [Xanthomonadales bacterium]HOP22265.1 efflux RND transporter permease subunit [Gammaproteobacteria bacterium]HPI96088.1 efflux RND transporter permease subunit [Gammaproteobacteria bacterium]HPQ87849.1 efflux RND transporter permease subunit [Gammaproteobacteria bacterium]
MNFTKASLNNPAALAVVIALISLFGYISIKDRPIQLLPNLSQPQISIFNNWRTAAPAEMESNIVEPQETILRRTPGLKEITSNINRGFANITLTFEQDTDMDAALINVINNLNQSPPLPVDAGEPFVAVGGQGQPNVASLQIYPHPDNPNPDYSAEKYETVLNDIVEARLARIPGVSRVNMQSRRPYEVRINFDPFQAAALGVPVSSVAQAISSTSDVSAGVANVGRRQYTVRFLGKYEIEELGNLIVSWVDGRPIHLNEIATVEKIPADIVGVNKRNGYSSYYITLQGGNDSNTIEILDELNVAIKELNEGALNDVKLTLELSYDSSVYIRRAIDLVKNNLGLGVVLSLATLWLFLRDRRSTLIIATSIPISLFVSFITLKIFDISLNVISLAGLAFSVGLILDAAIIVQENIVRYRQQGLSRFDAVLKGSNQVKGALFASTMTTIAIFLPILFLEGMEGQMFSDLAITLSVSVLASFIAAITIIPVASRKWMQDFEYKDPFASMWENITNLVMKFTDSTNRRLFWSAGLLSLTIGLSVWLMPKADFLPPAKADAVQTFFNTPPGMTAEIFDKEIAKEIIERLKPHMEHIKEPYIKGYNLSFFGAGSILYLYPLNPEDTETFVSMLRDGFLAGIPDTQAFPSRASLLGVGNNGGRSINVNLQGPDVSALLNVARQSMGILQQELPGAVVRPLSGLSLSEPELQIIPNERFISEAGLNLRDVANAIRAFTGGMFVGEYFDGNNRYNMILRSDTWSNPDQLAALPISTPLAGAQTIGSLATIKRTVGPTQLQRIDGQKTVSLQVLPIDTMTVEEALDVLLNQVTPQIKQLLPDGASVQYKGSADRLESALGDMLKNFILAVIILFLIMAAIFKSLKDSMLVITVMPLALAGGIVALKILNMISYQSLDMLTMIGFIILLGLVVNNAILLVSQTRDGESEGLSRSDAVKQAVLLRSRPVYMSTLTSIVGMLPLLLIPGVGSDIYRGLATVIIGGMVFSMFFTLLLMPSLLRMGEQGDVFHGLSNKFKKKFKPSSPPLENAENRL